MQLFLEFRHLSLHDLPISIPESVNCLFYIPHHKIRIPLRHTVAYKWLEISPLYPGRVLKFIDHHRMQSLTYFLKYNHRILISYILMRSEERRVGKECRYWWRRVCDQEKN